MEKIIIESILKSLDYLIMNSISQEKINTISSRHLKKIHFIPLRYRILGGILQSMNIQFGNFLEDVIGRIVSSDTLNSIKPESGKKRVAFKRSHKASEYINNYISRCQIELYTEDELKEEFSKCLGEIRQLTTIPPFSSVEYDVDLFFYTKREDSLIYCEIKYNDDHDTGKFIDINRKFLMTYALLSATTDKKIDPYLFYFTNKRLKGNPYVPENHILRGSKFFDRFTNIQYEKIDAAFQRISETPEINVRFDKLTEDILKRKICTP